MTAAFFIRCPASGLQRAPVGVRAGTDADESWDEDGGSEYGDDESDVHLILLWRARPDIAGIAALYYCMVDGNGLQCRRC